MDWPLTCFSKCDETKSQSSYSLIGPENSNQWNQKISWLLLYEWRLAFIFIFENYLLIFNFFKFFLFSHDKMFCYCMNICLYMKYDSSQIHFIHVIETLWKWKYIFFLISTFFSSSNNTWVKRNSEKWKEKREFLQINLNREYFDLLF